VDRLQKSRAPLLLTATGGNNQSTLINTAFAEPLVVLVTAKDGIDPVAGGQIAARSLWTQLRSPCWLC
jgi:hypothetical protein